MHPLQNYYSRIHKTYDLVNRLFTFGMDRTWRKHTVAECLKSNPAMILDLCCGTGDIGLLLAKEAQGSCFITGYDRNADMLSLAKAKAEKTHTAIQFLTGDVAQMPFENETFDCITIGFGFRNLTWENPDQHKHISEIYRVMKPAGRLLILESAAPQNRIIRFFHAMYLKTVLIPLGGLLSGNWLAYRYLAGSSASYYSFEELQQLMQDHRFHLIMKRKYLFGSVNLLEAVKKPCE